ncbi:imidazolonepropionase-like amidohydrolase [Micromonospora pisi]|uniref:Imidazolonepropionase-like amidohydrolase n=1 Tax=Micromonospora pisi TaxID=589240 RepID=A0A495JSW3_9ACTN|nr:amidohydrolase family protein [Micromonospora pisi]RKR92090.1 imidazolonepropionase-like amidohydrolase [Micromonospora pisi]
MSEAAHPESASTAPEPTTAPESSRREFLRWLSLGGVGVAATGGALLAAAPKVWAEDPADAAIMVLAGATVIDGTNARPRPDTSVVLAGDRIVSLIRGRPAPRTNGVRIVDARGKFVIPGLWDMHAHGTVDEDIFPPLHLANGVTGIREMWGYPEVEALRRRIDAGQALGPRMRVASPIIDEPPTILGPPAVLVRTPTEARAAVRRSRDEGADFVKVYSYLGRDAYFAIMDEARRQRLPVAGHLPYRVTAAEASDLGQRSFEHLFGLPVATSLREREFTQRIAETPVTDPTAYFYLMREWEWEATESFSLRRAVGLFRRLARNGTWLSPTLAVNRVVNSPADTFAADPRMRYMPASYRATWAERVKIFAPNTPERTVRQREFFQFLSRLVGHAQRTGVAIVGGTDCGNPYCFPGFSLHDELALLVDAGLSELEALQSVTRNAARYLGEEQTTGTVQRGRVADLVLLDADPLADIRNTRRIHAVVTRGRLITSAQRSRMLADVESAAANPTLARRAPSCPCHPALPTPTARRVRQGGR